MLFDIKYIYKHVRTCTLQLLTVLIKIDYTNITAEKASPQKLPCQKSASHQYPHQHRCT